MKSDIEIAAAATLRPISEVAADLGLQDDEIELYGRHKAKIDLTAMDRVAERRQERPPPARWFGHAPPAPPAARRHRRP